MKAKKKEAQKAILTSATQALFQAITDNSLENLKKAIAQNADFLHMDDVTGNTPLHCMAQMGRLELLHYVLTPGFYRNLPTALEKTNKQGFTPLQLAAQNSQWAIAIALINKGSDFLKPYIDPTVSHKLHGLIHTLAQKCTAGEFDTLLKSIPEKKRENFLTQRDTDGKTALHHASEVTNQGMIECFIQLGANPNTPDHYGYTPLHGIGVIDRKKPTRDAIEYLLNGEGRLTATNQYQETAYHKILTRLPEHTEFLTQVLWKELDIPEDQESENKKGLIEASKAFYQIFDAKIEKAFFEQYPHEKRSSVRESSQNFKKHQVRILRNSLDALRKSLSPNSPLWAFWFILSNEWNLLNRTKEEGYTYAMFYSIAAVIQQERWMEQDTNNPTHRKRLAYLEQHCQRVLMEYKRQECQSKDPQKSLMALPSLVEYRAIGLSKPDLDLSVLRRRLREHRKHLNELLDSKKPIKEIIQDNCRFIQSLTSILFQTALSMANPDQQPISYALLGLGSLSQHEMAPYSDLEIVVLYQSSADTPCLQKAIQCVKLILIALGETPHPSQQVPVNIPMGYRTDEGFFLLHTPDELLQYQKPSKDEVKKVQKSALRETLFICGNPALFKTYQENLQAFLKTKSDGKKLTYAQCDALEAITNTLEHFSPDGRVKRLVDENRRTTHRAFHIKEDFYRFPTQILQALCLFYDLKIEPNPKSFETANTQRITLLKKRRYLTEENAKSLQALLDYALRMRFKAHLHYGEECELLHHPNRAENASPILLLSEELKQQLLRHYTVLFNLESQLKQFVESKEKDLQLHKVSLQQSTAISEAKSEYFLLPEKAEIEYQQAIRLKPEVWQNHFKYHLFLSQQLKGCEHEVRLIDQEAKDIFCQFIEGLQNQNALPADYVFHYQTIPDDWKPLFQNTLRKTIRPSEEAEKILSAIQSSESEEAEEKSDDLSTHELDVSQLTTLNAQKKQCIQKKPQTESKIKDAIRETLNIFCSNEQTHTEPYLAVYRQIPTGLKPLFRQTLITQKTRFKDPLFFKTLTEAIHYELDENNQRQAFIDQKEVWKQIIFALTTGEIGTEDTTVNLVSPLLIQDAKHPEQIRRKLDPKIQAQLLTAEGCFKQNQINNSTHRVIKIKISLPNGQTQTLYCKAFPEMPGMSYLIERLHHQLIAHGTCLSELVKLECPGKPDIPILISQEVLGDTLQKVIDEKPEELRRLDRRRYTELAWMAMLTNPEDGLATNHILHDPNPEVPPTLVSVDHDHALFPPFMLASRIQQKKSVKSSGMSSILESDETTLKEEEQEDGISELPSFSPKPRAQSSKSNPVKPEPKLQVKTILFCLDLMNEPIDREARDAFRKLDPGALLQIVLLEAQQQNEQYERLFTVEEIQKFHLPRKTSFLGLSSSLGGEACTIPIPLKQGDTTQIYQKIVKLQNFIRPKFDIPPEEQVLPTLLECLLCLEPRVGLMYQKALQENSSPTERLKKLGEYKVNLQGHAVSTTDARSALLTENPVHQEMYIRMKDLTPEQGLAELDQLIYQSGQLTRIQADVERGEFTEFKALISSEHKAWIIGGLPDSPFQPIDWTRLNPAQQIELLNAMVGVPFHKLRLGTCKALTREKLISLLKDSRDLVSLDLSGHPELDDTWLPAIFIHIQYNLQNLYLNRLPKLTQVTLKLPGQRFKYLQHLAISDNSRLEQIQISAPALKFLQATDNLELTHVQTNSQMLAHVNLKNNPKLKHPALNMLVDQTGFFTIHTLEVSGCAIRDSELLEKYPILLLLDPESRLYKIAAQYFQSILEEPSQDEPSQTNRNPLLSEIRHSLGLLLRASRLTSSLNSLAFPEHLTRLIQTLQKGSRQAQKAAQFTLTQLAYISTPQQLHTLLTNLSLPLIQQEVKERGISEYFAQQKQAALQISPIFYGLAKQASASAQIIIQNHLKQLIQIGSNPPAVLHAVAYGVLGGIHNTESVITSNSALAYLEIFDILISQQSDPVDATLKKLLTRAIIALSELADAEVKATLYGHLKKTTESLRTTPIQKSIALTGLMALYPSLPKNQSDLNDKLKVWAGSLYELIQQSALKSWKRLCQKADPSQIPSLTTQIVNWKSSQDPAIQTLAVYGLYGLCQQPKIEHLDVLTSVLQVIFIRQKKQKPVAPYTLLTSRMMVKTWRLLCEHPKIDPVQLMKQWNLLEKLVEWSQHPDPNIRLSAIRGISTLVQKLLKFDLPPLPTNLEPLLNILKQSTTDLDSQVRKIGHRILAELPQTAFRIHHPLLHQLCLTSLQASSQYKPVITELISYLIPKALPEAKSILLKELQTLSKDPDWRIREKTASGLWADWVVTNSGTSKALLNQLAVDESPDVRQAVAQGWAKQYASSVDPEIHLKLFKQLESWLGSYTETAWQSAQTGEQALKFLFQQPLKPKPKRSLFQYCTDWVTSKQEDLRAKCLPTLIDALEIAIYTEDALETLPEITQLLKKLEKEQKISQVITQKAELLLKNLQGQHNVELFLRYFKTHEQRLSPDRVDLFEPSGKEPASTSQNVSVGQYTYSRDTIKSGLFQAKIDISQLIEYKLIFFSKSKKITSSVVDLTKALQTFLNYVVDGEEKKAEKMLRKTPELATLQGTITDRAGRTFRKISGFQYAIWARDWQMWDMILRYLPRDLAKIQFDELETEGTEHGRCFDLKPLIQALSIYVNQSKEWWNSTKKSYWDETVGGAQRKLPVNLVQEYCCAERGFDFTTDFTRRHTRQTRAYLALKSKNSKELQGEAILLGWYKEKGYAWSHGQRRGVACKAFGGSDKCSTEMNEVCRRITVRTGESGDFYEYWVDGEKDLFALKNYFRQRAEQFEVLATDLGREIIQSCEIVTQEINDRSSLSIYVDERLSSHAPPQLTSSTILIPPLERLRNAERKLASAHTRKNNLSKSADERTSTFLKSILDKSGLTIGAAFSEGDCFFDSVGEVCRESGREPHDMKSLRVLCSEYLQKKEQEDATSESDWTGYYIHGYIADCEGIKDAEEYIRHLRFTEEEICQAIIKVNGEGNNYVLWGKPGLEGRILCDHFKIKLHIILIQEGGHIRHQLITRDGVKSIGESDIDYVDDGIIHIVNFKNHFMPLLKHPERQQNLDKEDSSAKAQLPGLFHSKENGALRAQLLEGVLRGERIYFQIQKISARDAQGRFGSCGFNALGTNREDVLATLRGKLFDPLHGPEIRSLIAAQIDNDYVADRPNLNLSLEHLRILESRKSAQTQAQTKRNDTLQTLKTFCSDEIARLNRTDLHLPPRAVNEADLIACLKQLAGDKMSPVYEKPITELEQNQKILEAAESKLNQFLNDRGLLEDYLSRNIQKEYLGAVIAIAWAKVAQRTLRVWKYQNRNDRNSRTIYLPENLSYQAPEDQNPIDILHSRNEDHYDRLLHQPSPQLAPEQIVPPTQREVTSTEIIHSNPQGTTLVPPPQQLGDKTASSTKVIAQSHEDASMKRIDPSKDKSDSSTKEDPLANPVEEKEEEISKQELFAERMRDVEKKLAFARKRKNNLSKFSNEEISISLRSIMEKNGLSLGVAFSEGDCFFDSIAEICRESGRAPHDMKSLRVLCSEYLQKKEQEIEKEDATFENDWTGDYIHGYIADGEGVKDAEEYIRHLRLTEEEVCQAIIKVNGEGNNYVLWGKPELEGRILCDYFKIKLHIISIQEGGHVFHQLITQDGVESIGESDIDYVDDGIIHIVNFKNHFMPLLKHPELQQNLDKEDSSAMEHTIETKEHISNRVPSPISEPSQENLKSEAPQNVPQQEVSPKSHSSGEVGSYGTFFNNSKIPEQAVALKPPQTDSLPCSSTGSQNDHNPKGQFFHPVSKASSTSTQSKKSGRKKYEWVPKKGM